MNGKNFISGTPLLRTPYDTIPLFANFYPNTDTSSAESRISVIYFTGRGGNAMGASEVRMAKELTDNGNIDVHIVRLPGRHDRSEEEPYVDISIAIHDISNAILSAHDSKDTLIFAARSFGVALGVQVALLLEDKGIKIDSFHMITPLGSIFLKDELMVRKWNQMLVDEYGAPKDFDPHKIADNEAVKMILALEDYRRSTGVKKMKLNAKVLHYIGTDDICSELKYFNLSDISDSFQRYAFPGGHNFLDKLNFNILLPQIGS